MLLVLRFRSGGCLTKVVWTSGKDVCPNFLSWKFVSKENLHTYVFELCWIELNRIEVWIKTLCSKRQVVASLQEYNTCKWLLKVGPLYQTSISLKRFPIMKTIIFLSFLGLVSAQVQEIDPRRKYKISYYKNLKLYYIFKY